eukprot:scaffold6526_cov55-Phaeocystis_antarctica.AAC.2
MHEGGYRATAELREELQQQALGAGVGGEAAPSQGAGVGVRLGLGLRAARLGERHPALRGESQAATTLQR